MAQGPPGAPAQPVVVALPGAELPLVKCGVAGAEPHDIAGRQPLDSLTSDAKVIPYAPAAVHLGEWQKIGPAAPLFRQQQGHPPRELPPHLQKRVGASAQPLERIRSTGTPSRSASSLWQR